MYVRTSDGLGQATPTGSTRQVNRSSPEHIRWVQRSLNSIPGLNLKADGIMGPQTRSAIRSFQQKQGLVADGVVGPKTEAALVKATGAGAPGPVMTMPTEGPIRPAAARLTKFEKNSAKLKDFHAPEIDRVADRVVESWKTGQPIFTIYVKGHTSSEGPAQYNIALGNHRALAVRKALQKALERKQKNLSYKVLILAQSKGAREPIDTNETEEGRSQNRRVEVFLSTKALLPKMPPKPPVVTPPKPPVVTPSTENIPWILPDLPRPTLPTDGEPLCDLPSYQKEIQGCKDRLRSSLIASAIGFGVPPAMAIGYAGSALAAALSGLWPAAVVLAVAANYVAAEDKIKFTRSAYAALKQFRECIKAAKATWHCL